MDQEILLMMGEDKEIWAEIQGHEGYEVSSHGRIRSWKRQKGLGKGKGCEWVIDKNSSPHIKSFNLTLSYATVQFHPPEYVHRLVAKTFIPNPYQYTEIDHIDRNKANNHISNLRWCSRIENVLNTKIRKDNTSGYKGVRQTKTGWQACWSIHKKMMTKWFKTKEEAIVYRKKMEELHY